MSIATKRIDASIFDKVEDADYQLQVHVTRIICAHANPSDPENCALVRAAKQQGEFEKFVVHRTIAYGFPKGGTTWLRWQSNATTRKFVERFDKGDYSDIGDAGVVFTFKPPRPAVSLSHLRSPAAKTKRAQSAKARNGKPKRAYRLPDPKTLAGVRNRFGYHR